MQWLAQWSFDWMIQSSEGSWFEATCMLVFSLMCCFFRRESLLHIVCLHPGA